MTVIVRPVALINVPTRIIPRTRNRMSRILGPVPWKEPDPLSTAFPRDPFAPIPPAVDTSPRSCPSPFARNPRPDVPTTFGIDPNPSSVGLAHHEFPDIPTAVGVRPPPLSVEGVPHPLAHIGAAIPKDAPTLARALALPPCPVVPVSIRPSEIARPDPTTVGQHTTERPRVDMVARAWMLGGVFRRVTVTAMILVTLWYLIHLALRFSGVGGGGGDWGYMDYGV